MDFTSEFVSRFNEQRDVITDKEGTEAKNSINYDLKSIKTMASHMEFMNDTSFMNVLEENK